MRIYKIFRDAEWREFEAEGRTKGAPIDVTDGYIHFSTAAQVAETAAKHFAGEDGLWLLTLDAEALSDELKWEPSRGGQLFPHLYRDLEMADITDVQTLPLGPDGHVFPDLEA